MWPSHPREMLWSPPRHNSASGDDGGEGGVLFWTPSILSLHHLRVTGLGSLLHHLQPLQSGQKKSAKREWSLKRNREMKQKCGYAKGMHNTLKTFTLGAVWKSRFFFYLIRLLNASIRFKLVLMPRYYFRKSG